MHLLIVLYLFFEQTPVHHYNVDKKNVYLEGIDPVSYYTEKKPTKGLAKWAKEYQGVIFYFTSQANQQLFQASPHEYLPQYGGWCAYAMGLDGSKVEVDPFTYKLIDKKLYLFYNTWPNNTLNDWNKDEKNLLNKADLSWTKIIKSTN